MKIFTPEYCHYCLRLIQDNERFFYVRAARMKKTDRVRAEQAIVARPSFFGGTNNRQNIFAVCEGCFDRTRPVY